MNLISLFCLYKLVSSQGDSVSDDESVYHEHIRDNFEQNILAIILGCVFGIPIFVLICVVIYRRLRKQVIRFHLKQWINGEKVQCKEQSADHLERVNQFNKCKWTLEQSQRVAAGVVQNNSSVGTKNNIFENSLILGNNIQRAESVSLQLRESKVVGNWLLLMSGTDYYGGWKAEGEIAFIDGDHINLYMFRTYDNKKQAGQQGDRHTLIYRGSYELTGDQFRGDWYYHGFQGSTVYSGYWLLKMLIN